MRELGRMFRTYCHTKHSDWPQYVPYIEWTLNNVRHKSTHFTPSELFLKQSQHNLLSQIIQFLTSDLPDYDKKLILANEVQMNKSEARIKRHDKKVNWSPFKVNDLVLVKTHKLSNQVDKKIAKFFLLYDGP